MPAGKIHQEAISSNHSSDDTMSATRGSPLKEAIIVDAEREVSPPEDLLDDDPVYSYDEQRKIIHKVDRRLVLMLGFMYCVSLMDRNNLPNAAIAGMNVDLGLTVGYRYSIIALIFFITYTLCQPPGVIVMRFATPRIFLAGLCILWGIVMLCFGFPKSWEPMIGLRLLLGLLEAGFFPGSIYLIATWFTRYDLQKRYAVFYMCGCIASGGSGILAYGLQQMHGLGGLAGWRWIFIIEGLLTIVIGVTGYIFLVDFPDQAVKKTYKNFLTTKEIEFIIRRINKDRNDAVPEEWSFSKWLASATDWKIWSFALIYFCLTTMAYALAFFLPIILRENMGFSIAEAQCLSAPQYVAAALVMWGAAWLGDRYHVRGPIILFSCTLTFIGLPLMGFAKPVAVRFFGTFLVAIGPNVAIPTALAYQANNIRGHWKRAFSSASLIGFGGIGGIAGSLVFRTQDSPHYRPGIYAALACNSLVVLLVVANTVVFKFHNREAELGRRVLEGEKGFRYTI